MLGGSSSIHYENIPIIFSIDEPGDQSLCEINGIKWHYQDILGLQDED